MSWPLVKIKDCCTVVGGATPRRNIEENWKYKDVPWITPKDISKLDSPVLYDAPEYISTLGFKNCSAAMLPVGSVLLTSRAPIGNLAIAGREMCTNQGFKSLIPGQKVDSTFLYYCMLSQVVKLEALGNGATFKEVSKKIVEEFEIPLPPLAEQKRIAAILDKADAIRRKRQQAIQLADDFLRSVFLDMFGDPVGNPKGWEVKPLGKLVNNLDGKRKPVKSSDRANMSGEYPYYGASGIIDYVDSFLFEGRTLLIGEDGANLLARSTPIAFIADGEYWVNNHAHVLSEKNNLSLDYLRFSINLRSLSSYISGSAQPKLNQANLNIIPIQVPDDNLISKFDRIVAKCLVIKDELEVFEQQPIFNSLSQKAFKGEL